MTPVSETPATDGRATTGSGGERAVPFHCPYCGDENLWPHEGAHGAWECRACLRAFQLSMLGLVRPGGAR